MDAFIGEGGQYFNSNLATDEDGNYIVNEHNVALVIDDEFVETQLKFDFVYLRYPRSYFFEDTFEAGSVDWDSYERERAEEIEALPEAEWFKVRAGDKLDCGLTVKSAEYLIYAVEANAFKEQTVKFDGELTLEGVLRLYRSGVDYIIEDGDLLFIPDTTKAAGIPVISSDYKRITEVCRASYLIDDKFLYIASDIGPDGWMLGKIDDAPIDEQAIFGKNTAAKVKITLKNIEARCPAFFETTLIYAEIADVELID